jgi:hypothetical protein
MVFRRVLRRDGCPACKKFLQQRLFRQRLNKATKICSTIQQHGHVRPDKRYTYRLQYCSDDVTPQYCVVFVCDKTECWVCTGICKVDCMDRGVAQVSFCSVKTVNRGTHDGLKYLIYHYQYKTCTYHAVMLPTIIIIIIG